MTANTLGGASAPLASSTVVAIRPRICIPEANRPEDRQAIAHRTLINAMDRLDEQKRGTAEHGDNGHEQALFLIDRAAAELPCAKLRVIPKPQGNSERQFWEMLRRFEVAEAEARLVEKQFGLVLHLNSGADGEDWAARDVVDLEWSARRDAAREAMNAALMDLARHPVDRMHFHDIKRNHAGARKWLAEWRKPLAAILDEEEARLLAEKQERKSARNAKRLGRL